MNEIIKKDVLDNIRIRKGGSARLRAVRARLFALMRDFRCSCATFRVRARLSAFVRDFSRSCATFGVHARLFAVHARLSAFMRDLTLFMRDFSAFMRDFSLFMRDLKPFVRDFTPFMRDFSQPANLTTAKNPAASAGFLLYFFNGDFFVDRVDTYIFYCFFC